MVVLRYPCRICKKVMRMEQIPEFTNLPPNVVCVKCLGCGVLGIELLINAKPLREVHSE